MRNNNRYILGNFLKNSSISIAALSASTIIANTLYPNKNSDEFIYTKVLLDFVFLVCGALYSLESNSTSRRNRNNQPTPIVTANQATTALQINNIDINRG